MRKTSVKYRPLSQVAQGVLTPDPDFWLLHLFGYRNTSSEKLSVGKKYLPLPAGKEVTLQRWIWHGQWFLSGEVKGFNPPELFHSTETLL